MGRQWKPTQHECNIKTHRLGWFLWRILLWFVTNIVIFGSLHFVKNPPITTGNLLVTSRISDGVCDRPWSWLGGWPQLSNPNFVTNVGQIRHKMVMGKLGSSQNHYGENGFVTKSLWGKWARHKTFLGKLGSSQNHYGENGFVTKPFAGARHKAIWGRIDSSQNNFGGVELIIFLLGKMGSSQNHLVGMGSSQNHLGGRWAVTKSVQTRWIRHKIIWGENGSSQN